MLFAKVARSIGQQSMRLQSALTTVCEQINVEIADIKGQGTYKKERIITSNQDVIIRVNGCKDDILNFCANNYLGLSSNKQVIDAGKHCLDTHGAGLSSVRFICGTQDIHRKLEKTIANFHHREDAILYAACFDANAGVFEVLLNDKDAIITDRLNHASIIDGIRLCKAQRHVYNHIDLNDLERKLKETKDCRRRLIVTDGVFSMDGDVAPLKDICNLADQYNALVFIDECHATGFMGDTGRGTEEHLKMGFNRVHILNSTLGKALGGAMGGYTTAAQPIIDLLRQRSRPYLFSNSLAPPVVGQAQKVFELLVESNGRLAQSLRGKVARFRNSMAKAGFTVVGDQAHPICPVMLGDAQLASNMADQLLLNGIYVIGFSYPVVPKGQARIRVQISAAHTDEQIDKCVTVFTDIGKKMGIV